MLRVIIVLFLGITVVSLVLKFPYPSTVPDTEVAAQEGTAEDPALDPTFLPPPPTDSEVRGDSDNTVGVDVVPTVTGMLPAPDLQDTPDLAGALLHQRSESFLATLEQHFPNLHSNRKLLLGSFSLAVAGRPEQAAVSADNLSPGEGVSSEEFTMLQAAVSGSPHEGIAQSNTSRQGSVPHAMRLALLARDGQRLLQERRWQQAAETLSRLLLEDLQAPWVSDPGFTQAWASMLNKAQANHRWNPSGAWAAIEIEVQPGDNLSLIRSRAIELVDGLRMCTGLVSTVNDLGDRYLQPGEVLRVPTDPVSCLVDLEARHVFYFFGKEIACAWPAAIGASESETPIGAFVVGDLIQEPAWFRPGMPMIPYGDPKNELGTHWIGWNRIEGESTHYGFHGTWEPESVGTAVSDGCIRLRNEDVEHLYRIIPRGTSIRVQQ